MKKKQGKTKAAPAPQEEVIALEPIAVKFITGAKLLDVSESTARKLAREGKLETVMVGSDRRLTVKSIKRFSGAA